MPVDPLTSALVGSVINAAVQGMLAPSSPPIAAPAPGIVRNLPLEAKKGLMRPPQAGNVQIDDQVYPLSPGVVIRDAQNLVIPPVWLRQSVIVRYQLDAMGAVQRVWILSIAEANLADIR